MLTNHTRPVLCLAFSPDQKILASGSSDFLIKLWDTARWQETNTLRGSLDELNAMAFSPDGKALVSSSKNGTIKTWNPVPQVRPPEALTRRQDAWRWWLSDGTLFCDHTNGVISYWNPATGSQTARYDTPDEVVTNSESLDLTPSGRMVWATKQSEIVVWDLAARRELRRLPWVGGETKFVTVSSDERFLVAAAAGKCLTVWDLEKMQEVATLPKSADAVRVVRFSRDLHLLAAGNEDGTVEVWDFRRKERVADWQAHREKTAGVEFMPDGKQLVTVSDDATARVWDIETGREVRSFTRP